MVGLIFILLFSAQDTVTATTYKLTKAENGPYGNNMASGYRVSYKRPGNNKVIAVSPDLLEKFPYHTDVEIKGAGKLDGKYKVEDVMSSRWHNRIDILLNWKVKQDKFYNVIIKSYGKHQGHPRVSERSIATSNHLRAKSSRKHIKRQHSRIKKANRQLKHRSIQPTGYKWKIRVKRRLPEGSKP
jgi:3D (Asp-Asp-Asp) domain-containing protein